MRFSGKSLAKTAASDRPFGFRPGDCTAWRRTVHRPMIIYGLLIPFAGTTLGAALVFLLRREPSPLLQTLLPGFASGVMIAASVWSLLLPAIAISHGRALPAWLPAAAGLLIGVAFLLLLDRLIPHRHLHAGHAEGPPARLGRIAKLMLAVTLHNVPEGMAVGVVLAGALQPDSGISSAAALALSLGIAIQNIPEGAILSMPMHIAGYNRGRSFACGVLSGVVEPVAGGATILLIDCLLPLLPWLLAFAAGAMLYVVVEELIPESQGGRYADWATVGLAIGFVLMMILDVALG